MSSYGWTAVVAVIALCFVTLAYVIVRRLQCFRAIHYDKRHEIPIQFKPLKGITFEMYIALLPQAPRTATQALLADLDRRGRIEITDSMIERKAPSLTECEMRFLKVVNKSKKDLFRHFFVEQGGISIKDPVTIFRDDYALYAQLVSEGLIDKDSKPKPFSMVGIIALLILVLIAGTAVFYGFLWDGATPDKVNTVEVLFLVFAILVLPFICGFLMYREKKYYAELSKFTPKGLSVLAYYDGLKRYIKHAEKERLAYFQDKHKSDFLELTPYLILFGMEGPWTSKLKHYKYGIIKLGV